MVLVVNERDELKAGTQWTCVNFSIAPTRRSVTHHQGIYRSQECYVCIFCRIIVVIDQEKRNDPWVFWFKWSMGSSLNPVHWSGPVTGNLTSLSTTYSVTFRYDVRGQIEKDRYLFWSITLSPRPIYKLSKVTILLILEIVGLVLLKTWLSPQQLLNGPVIRTRLDRTLWSCIWGMGTFFSLMGRRVWASTGLKYSYSLSHSVSDSPTPTMRSYWIG